MLRTLLKQAGHQHDAMLLGQRSVMLGDGTGDAHRQVEVVGALHLAEVEAVVQLLQHHQFGSHGCSPCYVLFQMLSVGLHILGAAQLYDTCFHVLSIGELHGAAVQAAMLYDEWTAVYADDFVFGESLLHAADGLLVGGRSAVGG